MCQELSHPSKRKYGYRIYQIDDGGLLKSYYKGYPKPATNVWTKKRSGKFHLFQSLEDVWAWHKEESFVLGVRIFLCQCKENVKEGIWDIDHNIKTLTADEIKIVRRVKI